MKKGLFALSMALFALAAPLAATAQAATPVETLTEKSIDIPLPMLALGVFIIAAGVLFAIIEMARSSRLSPLRRLPWYVDGKGKSSDHSSLVNAAVLKRAQDVASNVAGKAGYVEKLDRDIDAAGLRWHPGEVLLTAFGAGLAGVVAGFLFKGLVGAAMLGFVGTVLPLVWVRLKASKRRRAFYQQLPDVLQLISGSLRAGYSLQQAIIAVGEDGYPPASEEFGRAMAEVRLGASADDALMALSNRIDVPDFLWTVQAIQIHSEVGGNLAEILETIAGTIRERGRVKRHLRALTAEGRLSALILGALPFLLLGFLMWTNDRYLEPLFNTTMGLVMVAVSGSLMLVGFAWMRKIIRIEV
ncbi:MAG: type II secretion system F family protein [Actinomycetota bacterium]